MKRFLILLSLLFCNTVCADTINLHWLNYDGTTYQNSTCVIDSDLILPSTPPTKYGYTFTGWKMLSYQPIEYLESTGTQYIDTEFEGNLNTRFFVEFEPTRGSSDYNSAIIGGSMINSTQVITILIPIASGMSRTNRFGNKELQFPNNKCFLNNKYTIETDKNSIRLDGVPQGYFNTTNNFQTNTTLYIFKINQSNIPVGNLRIYKSKIWDNDVLVRDFIPVLDENNIPCMFDKVESKFYYNQGTGDFIAGPIVSK